MLRLRLTNVPGWQATLDGRPLALGAVGERFHGGGPDPPGSHVVELHYWPPLFSDGLVVAAVVVVGLGLTIAVAVVHRRWARRSRVLAE